MKVARSKVGSFSSLVSIAHEWLITLTDDVTDLDAAADALAERHGFAVSARLGIVRSFVATLPKETLAELSGEPSVTRILRNRRLHATAQG